MPASTPPYHSYLLRLWLAGDDENPQWRMALIDPQTGEQHGFARLEALMAFLRAKMEEKQPGDAWKQTDYPISMPGKETPIP